MAEDDAPHLHERMRRNVLLASLPQAELERFACELEPVRLARSTDLELPNEEMCGERFDIPQPDSTVFISWFEGGEVFRSGCCWERGHGRIFYFRPGHETFPIYYQPEVRKVLANAVRWAAPHEGIQVSFGQRPEPLEKL